MYKMKLWYSLEKNNGVWTIWLNSEGEGDNRGSGGCKKIYSSTDKANCLNYCKENKIKIKKGIRK